MKIAFPVFATATICTLFFGLACRASLAQEKTVHVNVVDASQHKTLQAAFDALGNNGGVVRIPPGLYEISEPLKLAVGDVLIEGSGSATHIKNTNTEGKPAIVIEPPKGTKSLWRVKLANLRLTGNEKSGDGVLANKIDEFFAEGVTVSYHGGDGIKLDGCYEDPRICDSLLSYNKKVGLNVIKCHDIVVSANHFEENQDAVRCVDSFNLCMNGNNVDDHLRHGVVIENTYGSVVTGNMIEECQGTGVILDRDCYGITLSANVIAHDFGGGIDLRGAHGCAVSANTFTIVPKRALVVGPGSGRITVTGNNFSDSYLGKGREKRQGKDRAAGGIILDSTAEIAITGNLFSGLDTKAIDYDPKACRQIVLSGNLITDCADGEASEAK
jgi:hypothetical protein